MKNHILMLALLTTSASFAQMTKQSITNFSVMRGQDGNGGDTVVNGAGGRSLLDLQESDELKFFTYELENYSQKVAYTYATEILGCDKGEYDYTIRSCADTPNDSAMYKLIINGKPPKKTYESASVAMDINLNQAISICNGSDYAKLISRSNIYAHVPTLRWAFVNTPLEDIVDEGAIKLSNSQSKRQVAIQKGDLVVIYKPEFDRMDQESKAALKLHELTLCAVKALNPKLIQTKGTAPIREFVRNFVNYASTSGVAESTPPQAVQAAARALLSPLPELVSVRRIELNAKSPYKRRFCDLTLFSEPSLEPNVIVACTFIADEAMNRSALKVSISSDPRLMSAIDIPAGRNELPDFGGESTYKFQFEMAKELVKKNQDMLLRKWQEYLSNR